MATNGPEPVGKMDAGGNWTKTNRLWIPKLDDGHRIRIARVKQELKLEERALRDGQQNLPGKADATLNEPQMEICSRVFTGILVLNQFLHQQMEAAAERARKIVPSKLKVERIKTQISDEIERTFLEHRPKLRALRKEDMAKQRDLRFFRAKNSLSRGAHYKEAVMLPIGIIVGLFVFESIINGSLFAEVVTNGLVGGAMLAGIISAINIASGIAAGVWGWRYLNHKHIVPKILGGSITVACHSLAIFWNIFVAHFREVAERFAGQENFNFDFSQLQSATLQHLALNGIFGIGSLQSWALLFLGIFIQFFAAKEGWDDLADRYPDYKKYDWRARQARALFDDALADLRDDARAAVEDIEAEAKAEVSKAHGAVNAIADLLNLAKQRHQEVRDSEDEWVAGGTQLLKMYRDLNTEVRDAGSAPAYFENFPTPADYRNRSKLAGLSGAEDLEGHEVATRNVFSELEELSEKAERAADEADESMKAIGRYINSTLQKLDRRVEAESENVTTIVNEELDDLEGKPTAARAEIANDLGDEFDDAITKAN